MLPVVRLLLVPCLICLSSGLAYAYVGVITDVSEKVELQRGEDVFAAQAGVNVESGDTLHSGEKSAVQVDMDDGSALSLGANSSLRIDGYRMREDKSVIAASIAVVSGWLRFAVAKLRRQDSSYRFHMPTAVLGVRGTEGVLEVTGEGGNMESHVLLESGEVDVAEQVKEGRLHGARFVLRPGEYASRRSGRMLRRFLRAPAAFRTRMPARLKLRLVRRVRMLKRRGVSPRRIRSMLRHNMQRHLRQQLRQRRVRERRGIQRRKILRERMRERRSGRH